jgi:Holliday junction resolvasome RuvABC endonuclease subunit
MADYRPLIMTLDLATNCGFAVGRLGAVPRYGSWRLKTGEDESHRANRNIACRLRDEFRVEKPDLLVVEAAMNPAAMHSAGNAHKTVTLLWMLQGAVDGVAGCYGLRVKRAHVQTVRKAVLGQARFDDPKKVALSFVQSLGFKTDSHDAADAIVMWLDEVGYRHQMGLRTAGILS